MRIAVLMLVMVLSCIADADRLGNPPTQSMQQSDTTSGQDGQIKGNQIKISIATGGGPYQPAKDTFHVGESIPLVISMTNMGNQPVYVCESGTIYQDKPQLLRDGQPLPYSSFRESIIPTAEKDKTCQTEDLPQQVLLPPKQTVVVDWFNLSQGATSLYEDGWYEPLPAGKYTLTNRRRLNCCDGQLLESDTISFVVIP